MYLIRNVAHVDSPEARRLKVLITVPPGLPGDQLEANMRHAVLTSYEGADSALGALSVFAWSGQSTDGPYSAAGATFAPHGVWADANEGTFLEEWEVKIDYDSGYFGEKPSVLAAGAEVTLANDADGPPTVLVSRSATSWMDEDTVVRVPRGTKARIVSAKELNGGDGRVTVRYEVEIAGSKKRGWVHAYAVHSG